jgi:hypothetical protein
VGATTTERPATPAELLNAAADRIATYGWVRGELYDNEHGDPFTAPCCVTGALWLSLGVDLRDDKVDLDGRNAELVVAAESTIITLVNAHFVPGWNDLVAADAAEVVETLRKAARAAA